MCCRYLSDKEIKSYLNLYFALTWKQICILVYNAVAYMKSSLPSYERQH